MVTRALLGGLLTAGLLALVGYGARLSDQSRNLPSGQEPLPPPVAAGTAPPLPPRPFAAPLDGVAACELLPAAQRAQLGFDRGPTAGTEEGFDDAGTCSFRNSTAKTGARLALVIGEGADAWTSDTAQTDTAAASAGGFPALVVRTPGLETACNVEVDVAPHQHLDVLYRDDGARPPASLEQQCAGARRVADVAVRTLTARVRAGPETPGR